MEMDQKARSCLPRPLQSEQTIGKSHPRPCSPDWCESLEEKAVLPRPYGSKVSKTRLLPRPNAHPQSSI